jgi:hypothetical protein
MDQRAAVRVPVRVRAQCRAQGIVIDGLVEDLSRTGLFLRAGLSVDLGAAVEIDLDLPNDETVHLFAEVVRVHAAGMALRLVGDVDQSRRALVNFIMRQYATAPH